MATRAEARRRKILANSEERLQRLTGRGGSGNPVDDTDSKYANEGDLDSRTEKCDDTKHTGDHCSPLREIPEGDDIVNHENPDKAGSRDEKDGLTPEKALSEPLVSLPSEAPPTNHKTNSASTVRYRRAPTLPTAPAQVQSETEANHRGEGDSAPSIVRQIEITRLASCVVTAVLTRWFLPTLLGYLVLKSSAIMFLALEGALFVHQKQLLETVMLPHKSHLMAGALLLCGIKPELIATYNRVMGVASAVFEDLMIFYFTFITCHLLIT